MLCQKHNDMLVLFLSCEIDFRSEAVESDFTKESYRTFESEYKGMRSAANQNRSLFLAEEN